MRRTALALLVACAAPEPDLVARLRADTAPCELQLEASLDEHSRRELLLLHAARRLGWTRTDPVVVAHLVEAQRRVWGEREPAERLLAEALQLGLDAADPAVRAHLVGRLRRALRPAEDPGDAALQRQLDAAPGRYALPERKRVRALFVAGDGADEALAAARTLAARAAAGEAVRGHAWWAGPLEGVWTEQEAGRRTGPAAARWWSQAPGGWGEPFLVADGALVVQVVEVVPALLPPLREVRARVLSDWRDARREEAERSVIELLSARCGAADGAGSTEAG